MPRGRSTSQVDMYERLAERYALTKLKPECARKLVEDLDDLELIEDDLELIEEGEEF